MLLNKKLKSLIITTGIILLSGCSTYTEFVGDKKLVVEKVGSTYARITHASLYTVESNQILLRGKLKRRSFQRGAIPGHLDVQLMNLDGKIFKEGEFRYSQKGSISRVSLFSIPIQIDPALISTVRIAHHVFGSHPAFVKPLWRDITLD